LHWRRKSRVAMRCQPADSDGKAGAARGYREALPRRRHRPRTRPGVEPWLMKFIVGIRAELSGRHAALLSAPPRTSRPRSPGISRGGPSRRVDGCSSPTFSSVTSGRWPWRNCGCRRCAAPPLSQANTVRRSGGDIVRRGIDAVQRRGRGSGVGCGRAVRLTVLTWDRDPNETSILLLLRS